MKLTKMWQNIFSCLTLMMFIVVLQPQVVAAGYNEFGLDDKTYYDIYIGGHGDDLSVIQSVKIVEIKEIERKKFLSIQTQFFESKRYLGLVAFEYVRAILPTHNKVIRPSAVDLQHKY